MKKTLSFLTIVLLVLVGCSPVYTPDSQFSASFTDAFTGETVDFTNLSTDANSYLWNFGDGTTSNSYDASHSYSTSGTYNVSLTAYNHNKQSTSMVVMQVYVPSTLDITVYETGTSNLVTGTSILLFESLAGWDTHLGNNAVANGYTDNNGELIIDNLFPGTYYIDIKSNLYSNWHLGAVSASNIDVAVGEGKYVTTSVDADYIGLTKSATIFDNNSRTVIMKSKYHHHKISTKSSRAQE